MRWVLLAVLGGCSTPDDRLCDDVVAYFDGEPPGPPTHLLADAPESVTDCRDVTIEPDPLGGGDRGSARVTVVFRWTDRPMATWSGVYLCRVWDDGRQWSVTDCSIADDLGNGCTADAPGTFPVCAQSE